MNIDFQEILKELEFRVPTGIIDLNQESQVTTLAEILRENGVGDANELAQKARVYFSYVNEAPKKKPAPKKSVGTKFKAFSKDGEKVVYFKTADSMNAAIKAGTHITPKQKETNDAAKAKGGKQKKTQPKTSTIKISGAEKRAAVKDKKSEPVDLDKGVAISVRKTKYDTTGSKKLDQKKANNRLKYLPVSAISTEKAVQNFKKKYPGQVTTNYNYPKSADELLKSKLPPAGYDALKSLMRMSKQGVFEPPISDVTDQYGAGQISAQANELAMQAVYAFPPTPEGLKMRSDFIKSLEDNANNIIENGGTPILDKSWTKHFVTAHDSFIANMNRIHGKGNWEVTGMTWDVRIQQESLGAVYDDKGDSTDINAQIKVKGEIANREVSCKKDWKIFLLNAGLGDAQNWYYTLGKKDEMRAEELSRMKEAKDPMFLKNKELQSELKSYDERALKAAPVKNKELQDNQMKSALKGFDFILKSKISPATFKEAIKSCLSKPKNDFYGIEKGDVEYVNAVSKYMSITKKPTPEGFRDYLREEMKDGSEKAFKKAILMYNKVMAEATSDKKWVANHRKITEDFVKDAAQKIATNSEFQDMLLRKLQEAIPIRSLVTGTEDMQINGLYVTQDHMVELFGTNDWNKIKEFLTIKIIDGEASLVYLAKGKKPEKPISLASIGLREKGLGYNGSIGLLCEPTLDFEKACTDIDKKLNKV